MNPRRPLGSLEKIKVRTLSVEQRTEDDSEYFLTVYLLRLACNEWEVGKGQVVQIQGKLGN